MEDFRIAHIVHKTIFDRREEISLFLNTDQLKSMEEYNVLMGELKFIANLEETILEANKKEEDSE